MCIIIHNEHGKQISQSVIEKAVWDNPDGFAFVNLKTSLITKTMDAEHMVQLLSQDVPFIAHCRYATRGKVNLANCHPFEIDHNWILFQNGTVELDDKRTCDAEQVANMLRMVRRGRWEEFLNMFEARFLLYNRKTGKVIKTGRWHINDGSHYSQDRVFKPSRKVINNFVKPVNGKHLVAVYGTLKEGHGNHHFLENSDFIDYVGTEDNYRLCVNGLPYLLDGVDNTNGCSIEMELYEVDDETFAELDRLEGHPTFYERKQVKVWMMGSFEICKAWVYFVDDYYDNGVYHASYEESGQHRGFDERDSGFLDYCDM